MKTSSLLHFAQFLRKNEASSYLRRVRSSALGAFFQSMSIGASKQAAHNQEIVVQEARRLLRPEQRAQIWSQNEDS